MRAFTIGLFVGLGWGCRHRDIPLDGSLTLRADGVTGTVVVTPGSLFRAPSVRVGIWGDGFATPGLVLAAVSEPVDGAVWVYFPLRTGVGEGEAALRIEGGTARMPLGARPDEHDVNFSVQDGVLESSMLTRLREQSDQQMAALERAWADGFFLIRDGETVVGEVTLRGADAAPLVAVYDRTWLSPGVTEAGRTDEGADLLLSFPVEPSLGGEQGLIRINVPTSGVVVPVGADPDPLDRHLRLVPGRVEQQQRGELVALAQQQARDTEHSHLLMMLPKLAAQARTGDGRCRAPGDVDSAWGMLLAGYDVSVRSSDAGCVVGIEPSRPQHGRRFRGEVGVEGLRAGAGARMVD